MHQVTEVELDTIASLSNSIHLALLGISIGSVTAFAIVLATVPLNENPTMAATFTGLTWISGIATLYFGALSIQGYRAAQAKLREIKGA